MSNEGERNPKGLNRLNGRRILNHNPGESILRSSANISRRLSQKDLVGSSSGQFRGINLRTVSVNGTYKCCIYVSPFHDGIPLPTNYTEYDNLSLQERQALDANFDTIGWSSPQYSGIPSPAPGDIVWCSFIDIYQPDQGVYLGKEQTSSGDPTILNGRVINPDSSVGPPQEGSSQGFGESYNIRPLTGIQGGWPDNTQGKSSLELSQEFNHPSFPLVPGDTRGPIWGLEVEDSIGLGRLAVYGQSNFGIRRSAAGYNRSQNRSFELSGGATLQYNAANRDHLGIDLNAPLGSPVYAVANARVIKMQPNTPSQTPRNNVGYGGFGISITLCCGPMGYVIYNHLNSIEDELITAFSQSIDSLQSQSDEEKLNRNNYPEVRAGQVIGENGMTFGATIGGTYYTNLRGGRNGSHVHLEWRREVIAGPGFRRRQRIAELYPTDPIASPDRAREDFRVLDPNYLLIPTGLSGLSVKEGNENNRRGATGQGIFFRGGRGGGRVSSRIIPTHLLPNWQSEKFPPHNVDHSERYSELDQKFYIKNGANGPQPSNDPKGQEFRRIRERQLENERSSEIQQLYERFPKKRNIR